MDDDDARTLRGAFLAGVADSFRERAQGEADQCSNVAMRVTKADWDMALADSAMDAAWDAHHSMPDDYYDEDGNPSERYTKQGAGICDPVADIFSED